MERETDTLAGRGRAGLSIKDRLKRRAASFSVCGTKSDGQKIQYVRKRRFLFDKQNGNSQSEFFSSFKRHRLGSMDRGQEKIVLPTKFLLGGNINDPLNLNSLNDEEINRVLNEKTPQSSPIRIPAHRLSIEVKIPVNIHDPLNLLGNDDEEPVVRPFRKRKRHRPKKRDQSLMSGVSSANVSQEKQGNAKDAVLEALKIDVEPSEEQETSMSDVDLQPPAAEKTQQTGSSSKLTKIVSPVIRQSPKIKKRRRTTSECASSTHAETSRALFRRSSSPDASKNVAARKFRRQTSGSSGISKPSTSQDVEAQSQKKNIAKKPQFIHGNYSRYYGYRNPQMEIDHRLTKLKPEWLEGKDVLDIGCNVGHVTLAIAQSFQPKKIVGIDIDHNLIRAARHNIRNYLSKRHSDVSYPSSSAINYGPIEAPPIADNKQGFPRNVIFMQSNYVLEKDEQLELVPEEYDTILALSLTKWLHLNYGDAGLKRSFHRMYRQLRPGGRLILEPQPWASYRKRKKLTETIYKNYCSIELRPEQFRQYLLYEIGFSKCEVIDVPFNKSHGFRRPLLLFTKTETQYNSPMTFGFVTPASTPMPSASQVDASDHAVDDNCSSRSFTLSKCSTCISGSCTPCSYVASPYVLDSYSCVDSEHKPNEPETRMEHGVSNVTFPTGSAGHSVAEREEKAAEDSTNKISQEDTGCLFVADHQQGKGEEDNRQLCATSSSTRLSSDSSSKQSNSVPTECTVTVSDPPTVFTDGGSNEQCYRF